jgi:Uma2 family endonuclease
LPSDDVDYELDHGRIIVMPPPGHLHSAAQAQAVTELVLQGQRKGHGRAFTKVGVLLSRSPDTVLVPDVAFVGKSKLPVRESPEGYLETIPDLVIEIRSKNDSRAELDRKSADYFAAGVRVVWIIDPEAKTISVRHAGAKARVYRDSETLEVDDPIPGFKMQVADVFGP